MAPTVHSREDGEMISKILQAVLIFSCVGLQAGEPGLDQQKLARDVGAVFAEKSIDNTTPGCAIGVIEKGQWALLKGFGMANLEHEIPISSTSIFRMGSLSKQFTAAAIALLAEDGLLDLDADIHEYLPDLTEYGHKVTVRQMIHHVSGIPDYEEGHPALKTPDGKDLRLGNQDYLSIPEFYERAKTITLFAPPETEFEYSNTAYFLLSQIVEAVSGKSLREYAQANIFARLDMNDSFFNDEVNDVVKNRVDGYTRNEDGGYSIYMTNLSWVGDGGVYTNMDDWFKWDQNFYHNILGQQGADFFSQMEQSFSVSGEYAWGQNVGSYRGLKQVSHTGSWVGFTTYYARFPERQISIVAMCNSNVINAGVGKVVRDLVLDQILDAPPP
jgi:CubicO group peptidase (beta-lactamase class C family)